MVLLRVWKQVHAACIEKKEFRLVGVPLHRPLSETDMDTFRLKFVVLTSSFTP
jgi:hypothetical protein